MKTAGKWLTWTGLAIGIVTVVVGIVMAIVGFGKLTDVVNDSFRVTGPTQHTARSGDVLVLYAPSSSVAGDPVCAITGPAPTRPGPIERNTDFTYDDRNISAFASYRFTQDGTYTIDCDRSGVVAGPELPVSGIFTGAGGVLLAVFGGLLGAVMLVLGVILWIIGANRAKTPPAPPAWQGGAPYAGQPYQPGAPQQSYRPGAPGQPYRPSVPQPPYPPATGQPPYPPETPDTPPQSSAPTPPPADPSPTDPPAADPPAAEPGDDPR
ncbi:hypothetical protein [Gordonia caeni]|uniref:Uncharacterized protein n=1 Tax=Gordonia caeni TaxID=1007097 RepID=A0ABP7NYZ7_9ACTN